MENIYAELWEIFKNLNMQDLNKISPELINYIYNHKNNNWKFKYNPYVELDKQELMEDTRNLFSIIYYKYCCQSDEKKKIMKHWLNNDSN